ncbi:MAG: hypothetical protein JF606_18995 [Burkholderiales bacterium]|nr:hypothetical protein [Burkholderiales bacterium]
MLILLTMPVTVFAGYQRARQGFTPAIAYTVAWMVLTACLAEQLRIQSIGRGSGCRVGSTSEAGGPWIGQRW